MRNFYLVFYRLKPLDISFMRAIHHKVNIVPVIAKSDTLTKQEVLKLKRKVTWDKKCLSCFLLVHNRCCSLCGYPITKFQPYEESCKCAFQTQIISLKPVLCLPPPTRPWETLFFIPSSVRFLVNTTTFEVLF